MKAIIVKDLNKEQLQSLVNYLITNNYEWCSSEKITIENIKRISDFEIEVIYLDGNCVSYSDINYLEKHSKIYQVITLEELINMEKSDLRPGMVVKYANSEKRLVVTINAELYLISGASFADIKSFNEDLTYDGDPKLNIVKVYQPKEAASLSTLLQCNNCIWVRPKETVLTMQEIADKFGIPVEQLKIKK